MTNFAFYSNENKRMGAWMEKVKLTSKLQNISDWISEIYFQGLSGPKAF